MRTVAMRKVHNANWAITAARYVPGVETLPWQAQLLDFGPDNSFEEGRPGWPLTVTRYMEIQDARYVGQFLDAERIGAIL